MTITKLKKLSMLEALQIITIKGGSQDGNDRRKSTVKLNSRARYWIQREVFQYFRGGAWGGSTQQKKVSGKLTARITLTRRF